MVQSLPLKRFWKDPKEAGLHRAEWYDHGHQAAWVQILAFLLIVQVMLANQLISLCLSSLIYKVKVPIPHLFLS